MGNYSQNPVSREWVGEFCMLLQAWRRHRAEETPRGPLTVIGWGSLWEVARLNECFPFSSLWAKGQSCVCLPLFLIIFIFKDILLIMLLLFSQFSPFISPLLCTPNPPAFLLLSSCPWVVHVSSLNSLFPISFLTSSRLVYAYQLCFLFPVLFPTIPPPSPTEPSMWCPFLWLCSCSSCLLSFCFHCFSFFLGSLVDSCEFVVILLFIVLIIFFFLDKSL